MTTKGTDYYLRKIDTTFPLIPEPPGFRPRDRECPERPEAIRPCDWSMATVPDSRGNQLARDVWGSSRPLLGSKQESESKRRRSSVSKGTREARLSMAVTKHLPMRRPSGGAPVVVRDANGVHMAKGCRMIRGWMTEMFFNLEGSK